LEIFPIFAILKYKFFSTLNSSCFIPVYSSSYMQIVIRLGTANTISLDKQKKSGQAFLSPLVVERLTSCQSLYLSASLNDNVNLRPVLITRNSLPHSEEHGHSASPSVESSRRSEEPNALTSEESNFSTMPT